MESNKFQDIRFAKDLIKRDFGKNKNRSLSAYFRYLRKDSGFTLFGDWVLMATIVKTIKEMGISPTRGQIMHMIKNSNELMELRTGERTKLIDQL